MKDLFKDFGIIFVGIGFALHICYLDIPLLNMLSYGITLHNFVGFVVLSVFSFLTFLVLIGVGIYCAILSFNDDENVPKEPQKTDARNNTVVTVLDKKVDEHKLDLQKDQYCTSCGRKLQRDDQYCGHCGKKVKM